MRSGIIFIAVCVCLATSSQAFPVLHNALSKESHSMVQADSVLDHLSNRSTSHQSSYVNKRYTKTKRGEEEDQDDDNDDEGDDEENKKNVSENQGKRPKGGPGVNGRNSCNAKKKGQSDDKSGDDDDKDNDDDDKDNDDDDKEGDDKDDENDDDNEKENENENENENEGDEDDDEENTKTSSGGTNGVGSLDVVGLAQGPKRLSGVDAGNGVLGRIGTML
ncbi:hypothetical protein EC973_008398 [Apophysomyces ossiformis]|uniref:Uncharacterized protein n=1 Tax=Apophysomyces ossiformis TaxID=679940 RepID=A0A8H7BTH3_9FUNG|nr:hypothetical protein EC973_008398 [Apophysomyces ossiformis]